MIIYFKQGSMLFSKALISFYNKHKFQMQEYITFKNYGIGADLWSVSFIMHIRD